MNNCWFMILNYNGQDMYGTGAVDYGVHPGVSMEGKNIIWELSIDKTTTIFVIDR